MQQIILFQVNTNTEFKKGFFITFHRIKDLREDADLTQAELAGYLHIADFYRVSIDYLLERTENKNINQ